VAGFAAGPTVSAVEEGGYYSRFAWSPPFAEVAAGGSVTFQNVSAVKHGVVWTGGPTTPVCSGVPIFKSVNEEGATNWKGSCTFSQAGTYTFVCTVHPNEMKGTITVAANGTTTTTTTGTTTGATTTPTTTPPPSPESPLAGSTAQAVKIAKSQHGRSVKGSIDLSRAAVGGRLEIDAFAQNASLAKAKHAAAVRVGRLVRSSLSAGKLSFSVKLNASARRALGRHHRLALTMKIVLTPTSGAALTVTRNVTVHA
jgi:plastocyanin